MANKIGQLVSLDAFRGFQESEKPLFGLDAADMAEVASLAGEPGWRGKQIAQAIYHELNTDINEITTLSKSFRKNLISSGWTVGRPRIEQVFQSVDGTERYLVQCGSGEGQTQTVETVWMPEGDGGETGDGTGSHTAKGEVAGEIHRATICVSSQVGCAVNCQFCLTAKLGLQRNLTAGEIAGQVLAVFDRHNVQVGRDRVNLVFMGMGEPFLNYDNFMAAVRLLVKEVGLSPQRMTVSTSGIVPGIEKFALEPPELRPKLALSLNAPNDLIRSEVMPINRKWSIDAVIRAVKQIRLRNRERVTFEYVLLGGVTDQPEHAREVARLVRRSDLAAKVNLIAWNPGPGIEFSTPNPAAVEAFRSLLIAEGIPTYLRRPRGRDIYAACGQLKRTVEK